MRAVWKADNNHLVKSRLLRNTRRSMQGAIPAYSQFHPAAFDFLYLTYYAFFRKKPHRRAAIQVCLALFDKKNLELRFTAERLRLMAALCPKAMASGVAPSTGALHELASNWEVNDGTGRELENGRHGSCIRLCRRSAAGHGLIGFSAFRIANLKSCGPPQLFSFMHPGRRAVTPRGSRNWAPPTPCWRSPVQPSYPPCAPGTSRSAGTCVRGRIASPGPAS